MATHAELVRAHHRAIETGDLAPLLRCVGAEHFNREAAAEPPATRKPGPAGMAATVAWLRFAFSNIHFEELDLLEDGDVVIYHVNMNARHTGPLVFYEGDRVAQVFPPTGRSFSFEAFHRYRVHNEATIEHIAVRDDFGLMQQLGYLPPSPAGMAKIAAWRLSGRAKRAGEAATAAASKAADEVEKMQSGEK
jgi:predicted ester cyclase